MRHVSLVLLLAGLLAPAALAASESVEDGTLAVKNGRGFVKLEVTGVVIAQIDAGRITVEDREAERGTTPRVRGAERLRVLSETKRRWMGSDMRVRLVGGDWKVTIFGRGIDLSVVGQGAITIHGRGDEQAIVEDGTYSLNDAPWRSLPDEPKTFQLP